MQKVLLLSFLFLTTQILQAQKNDNSPNFIFILADDQGWNGTSVKMIEDNEFSKSDYYETPNIERIASKGIICLLYTSPSPRDATLSRMPSSA